MSINFKTFFIIIINILSIQGTPKVYHPRIGDLHIGNFIWLPSSRFYDIYNRYSTSEPKLNYNSQNRSLKFENPYHQNFTLISQYIIVDNNNLSLRISHGEFDYYNSKITINRIIIRLIDGDNVFYTKSNLVNDSLFIEFSYKIDKLKIPLKIEIEFDANIKKGTVNNIVLHLSPTDYQIENGYSKFFSVTNKSFYSQTEEVTFYTKFMNRHSATDTLLIQIMNSNNELKYSAVKTMKDSITVPGKFNIGWYKLITNSYRNNNIQILSVYEFPVTPDPERKVSSKSSLFGIHVGMNKEGIKILKYLGAGWTRLHGTEILRWKSLEVSKGRWAFPDSMIDLFSKSSVSILGNLGETPAWASSFKDTTNDLQTNYYFGSAAYIPKDFNDWKNYIKTVVTRYKDKINYWEIWNEPDIDYFKIQNSSKAI